MWVFADTPHLLKLLRHHVLEGGMRLDDGTTLNVSAFNAVLKMQATSELRACHKLTPLHVTVSSVYPMALFYRYKIDQPNMMLVIQKVVQNFNQ